MAIDNRLLDLAGRYTRYELDAPQFHSAVQGYSAGDVAKALGVPVSVVEQGRRQFVDPVLRNANRVLRMAAQVLDDDDLEDDGGDSPFHGSIRSPKELRDPDLSQAHRLDREQEAQGLDPHRRVEDVRSVGMPVRSRSRGR